MATLASTIEFNGSIGNVTAYKREGSDKTILRLKTGPSKEQIQKSSRFVRTRENNTEWGACTALTSGIRHALFPVKHLGEPNFTGALNKLGKKLQQLDLEGARGQRSVYLSRNRHMLKGFSLNINAPFDGILRHPVNVQTDRDQASAIVSIPALIPDVSLFLDHEGAFSRFVVSLGEVSDVVFNNLEFGRIKADRVQIIHTDWLHTEAQAEAIEIHIQLDNNMPEEVSLILSIGVEVGINGRFGDKELIKRAGAAKVLEVF